MSMRKGVPIIAVALAILGVTASLYRAKYQKDPTADLLIAEVSLGRIEEAVLATGTLRPVRLVAVGAQVSGRITAMNVAVGQRVQKGDLIATIDSVTQENDLKTAEANLADMRAQKRQKEATLAYAVSVFEREQMTLAKQATSRDAWESARANVETTRAQIDSLTAQIAGAEVKVDTARINLAYTRITAPIDGTVLLVVAQEGQNVNAVQSAPTIVIIGQIERMAVRTEVSEADAPHIRIGQRAVFNILGEPRRQWEATLQSLDPAPDNIRSDSAITSASAGSTSSSSSTNSTAIYYYGWFEAANPDGMLRTYMTAQVRIVLGSADNVLTIPDTALSPPGPDGERTVEVVGEDGSVSRRAVSVGLDDKIRCEIRSGLKAGERVVIGHRSSEAKTSPLPSPPGAL